MFARLLALILKELLVILRDPRSRAILIGPPLVQLIVFAFAATLEVRNVDLVVLDRDEGGAGRELIARIEGSPTFHSVRAVHGPIELAAAVDHQTALLGIEIGPTFSRDVELGRPARVQMILDGRRSNAAQIVDSYIGQIVNTFLADQNALMHRPTPMPRVVARNWFNPNLQMQWATVPGLIGIIALLMGLIVTALSVAREREQGTFDQLMVAPLRAHEILIGKMVPPILIVFTHITLYVLATVFVFGVPLRGSLLLLYGSAFFFILAVVGVGLFLSALSMTQQQAILGAFFFMAPAVMLSGFATPIENMPAWLQPMTLANPLRYFLVIVRGVFLKAMTFEQVVEQTVPLIVIAAFTLTTSAWLFRKRME
jgi:ABC-2 type transport system permease protein